MTNLSEGPPERPTDSLNAAYAAMGNARAQGHLRPYWFILALAGIVSGLVMSLSLFQFELAVFFVLGLVLIIGMERRNAKVQLPLSKGELGAGLVFGLVLVAIAAIIALVVDPQWRLIANYAYGALTFLVIVGLGLQERQRSARVLAEAGQ